MTLLFNLFALFYVFRAVQLAVTIVRDWKALTLAPFTPQQKYTADQASFFIAVPVGVFLHELLHAVPVWAFGGQVVEFAYRVFWGYVVPDRVFAPPQEWFISLAGTLGNLVFGLLLWLVLRRAQRQSVRYFALRAFRFQVFFSLVYYPLFTLVLPIGDWRTIYDFGATPILSAVTAVAHAGMLLAYLWSDRNGRFEMVAFNTDQEHLAFAQLAQAAAAAPEDVRVQLRYIDALRRGGAEHQARTQLNRLQKSAPTSAEVHLQAALLQSSGKRQIPSAAAASAERALTLGLSDPFNTAVTHQILAQYRLDRGEPEAALHHVEGALRLEKEMETAVFPEQMTAQFYYLRAQCQRQLRRFELANHDIQQAISLAQKLDNNRLMQLYQDELTTIQRHAHAR